MLFSVGVTAGTAQADAVSSAKITHVRGPAVIVDPVAGTVESTGDMIGTWYTLQLDILLDTPAMDVQEGTERFVGCLDRNHNGKCGRGDLNGELFLDFIYWATFEPRTERLIRGQCVHPITRATGGLAGTRGVFTFKDLPVGDQVRTTYEGDLILRAVAEPAAAALPEATSGRPAKVASNGSTVAAC